MVRYPATYLLATFVSMTWAQSPAGQTAIPKNDAYDPANINYGFGGVLPKDVASAPALSRSWAGMPRPWATLPQSHS